MYVTAAVVANFDAERACEYLQFVELDLGSAAHSLEDSIRGTHASLPYGTVFGTIEQGFGRTNANGGGLATLCPFQRFASNGPSGSDNLIDFYDG